MSSTGIDDLLTRAFAALTPGSRIVLHDLMVDDGRGPATAALWLVNALLIDPDVARLSPSLLEARLRAHGFERVEHAEVIPGITRSLTAASPSSSTSRARAREVGERLEFGYFARISWGTIP